MPMPPMMQPRGGYGPPGLDNSAMFQGRPFGQFGQSMAALGQPTVLTPGMQAPGLLGQGYGRVGGSNMQQIPPDVLRMLQQKLGQGALSGGFSSPPQQQPPQQSMIPDWLRNMFMRRQA